MGIAQPTEFKGCSTKGDCRALKHIFSGFSSWFVQKFRHKTLRQFDVQNYFVLFHYTLVSWLQSEGFTPSSNREDTVYYTEMASSMAP